MSNGWKQEWNEEQRVFIDKLDKAEKVFQEIFEKDKDGMVIGYEERQELEKLRKKNKRILDKLQKQEFTVAVVGLEKAGKSTLGNALIKKDMLPEYTERCTYTTTEIRAGSEDFAQVYFYGHEEFQKKFQEMLKAVRYEKNADFFALERSSFDKFWNAMESAEPEFFQVHNGTTVEDIRAMLDGKSTIRELLGKEPRKFYSDDNGELQLYITGIGRRSSAGFVERTAHPYAVKNVVIQSTQLQDMEHVVLYDVPGFDSPTQLHKKQTEDMLKQADAIILVTNATEPSLKGTQLDMLRKGRDEDDVKLSEKVFVFGNKIDMARSQQIAQDNEATLRNEAVNKHMIAVDGRVVVGSAKAYLEKNGIRSKDDEARGAAGVNSTLQEWGRDDGIDGLKKRMMDYYSNNRYEILKHRAEKTLDSTEEYLTKILEKYSPEVLSGMDDPGTEYVVQATFALQDFVEEANEILKRHINEITGNRPFSRTIEENIEEICPYVDETNDEVKSILLKGAVYNSDNVPVTRLEAELREQLKTKFRRTIVEITASRTEEEQQKIRSELVDAMLRILGMSDSSSYKEELQKEVNDLFNELLLKNGERCLFNSLIERFTSSPIQAVITCPFGEVERYNHMTSPDETPEFISLAAYYKRENMQSASNDDSAMQKRIFEVQKRIFAQILAHEHVTKIGGNGEDYENSTLQAIEKFFQENGGIINNGVDLALNILPMGKWAKLLVKSGIKLSERTDMFAKLMRTLQNDKLQQKWKRFNANDKKKFIEDFITAYCDKNQAANHRRVGSGGTMGVMDEEIPLKDFIEEMNKQGVARGNQITTTEDVISEINTDVDILRDLTLHAIIWAIGLERAYTSVIEKNVELIRQGVQTNKVLMGTWLRKNIRKILENEFAAIVNEQAKNESRRVIVKSIREVLSTFNN